MIEYDVVKIVLYIFIILTYCYTAWVFAMHLLLLADDSLAIRRLFSAKHLVEHAVLIGLLAWLPVSAILENREPSYIELIELIVLLAVCNHLHREINLSESIWSRK